MREDIIAASWWEVCTPSSAGRCRRITGTLCSVPFSCCYTLYVPDSDDSFRKVFQHRLKRQSARLDYLDWLRGLAALIMLQGHAFDNWLHPQYRDGEWFWLSQFLGGLPAPIFLFLTGVSLALVLDRMRSE